MSRHAIIMLILVSSDCSFGKLNSGCNTLLITNYNLHTVSVKWPMSLPSSLYDPAACEWWGWIWRKGSAQCYSGRGLRACAEGRYDPGRKYDWCGCGLLSSERSETADGHDAPSYDQRWSFQSVSPISDGIPNAPVDHVWKCYRSSKVKNIKSFLSNVVLLVTNSSLIAASDNGRHKGRTQIHFSNKEWMDARFGRDWARGKWRPVGQHHRAGGCSSRTCLWNVGQKIGWRRGTAW